MSALKPTALTEFYRSLHARGESTDSLALKLNVSRPVVCKLIGLLKRRRGRTWAALLALLTERERALLLSVEQCSTWRTQQLAKRPRWNAEKVAGLAETYPARFEDERDRLRRAEADSFFPIPIPTSTKAIA